MYLSSMLRLVTCASIVLPVTVKSPAIVNPANVGVSVVCNPRSIVPPGTPLLDNLTSPCCTTARVEADIIDLPSSTSISALLVAIPDAREELRLAVAATNSASVVNVLSKEELNASAAVILVLIEALGALKAPEIADATPDIVFNWADPENTSPVAPLIAEPLMIVPLISPGAINVPVW